MEDHVRDLIQPLQVLSNDFRSNKRTSKLLRIINKILTKKHDIFVIVYLDDILIYTEDDRNGHVAAVEWVLEQLMKFLLYTNLKKCRFHQDKVRFLGYVISSEGIRMEDK